MKAIDTLIQDSPELGGFQADPAAWLARQGEALGLARLLAFAEDGVIWGKVAGGVLVLSGEAAPDVSPPLRLETLLECRLFGPSGELLLWRDGVGWRSRMLVENGQCAALEWEKAGERAVVEYIDEPQMLWGIEVEKQAGNFTTLVEKSQNGLRHAVPLPVTGKDLEQNRLRLVVRHYVEYDGASGEARLALSRLAQIGIVKNGEVEDGNP
jgi:CRISPR-associated protein (TIGR03984 family)